MQLWTLITSFGDAGLMVPTALIIAVWLVVAQGRAAALLWCALFVGAGLLVTATKIAFLGFGLGIHRFDFTGISGHSMMSMAVFPVALVLLGGSSLRSRLVLVSIGVFIAAMVAISRLAIRAHSPFEVLTGMMLGACVAGLFLVLAELPPARARNLPFVSFCLAVIFLLGYGRPAPSQDLVTQAALVLSGRDHPYTKQEWYDEAWRKRREREAALTLAAPALPSERPG
jgi:membrane-associated phospholipid phosphatase